MTVERNPRARLDSSQLTTPLTTVNFGARPAPRPVGVLPPLIVQSRHKIDVIERGAISKTRVRTERAAGRNYVAKTRRPFAGRGTGSAETRLIAPLACTSPRRLPVSRVRCFFFFGFFPLHLISKAHRCVAIELCYVNVKYRDR